MTFSQDGRFTRFAGSVIVFALCLGWNTNLTAGTPVPTYGTFFGGTSGLTVAVAVATDSSGNVVVAGYTTSQTLPGTGNAFQPTKAVGFPDNRNVFIAKFDPTGRNLLWATFLGGNGVDQPNAVALDSSGNIYVIGSTSSSNFPVTGDSYVFSSSNATQGFAAKVSANGTNLLYSTFLPGAANAIAVNNAGEAYIAGSFSAIVVTSGAIGNPVPPVPLNGEVSLIRLNSTGSGLVFGADLGGGGFNGSVATSVALDSQGNAYVAGFTGESNILTTANALQRQYSNPGTGIPCCSNGFVVEVSPSGTQLLYGTYFGLQYFATAIESLIIGPDGSLYISGYTNSTSQATLGAYSALTPNLTSAGFVAKLTPGRSSVDSFSYLPGGISSPEGATLPQPPTVLLGLGNQPEAVYAASGSPNGLSVIELSIPNLSLISAFASQGLYTTQGMTLFGAALASPHSIWLVGLFESCPSCSLGTLISADAFQTSTGSADESAILIQLADIAPTISLVGSSATGSSPFAAGQLISIYGTQLGPTPGSVGQENPNGAVTNSDGGTQVLFDGVAAPILYTSATQINTAIPCSVAGKASTQMVVQYLGASSSPFTVPLSAAAPGIFTINGSGSGEAVVLNQDYTLNGPSNPAARGSAVSFYATGIGPTSPCVDGQTYQANFPLATLPVIAGVGNLGAQVLYAGQAPYFMTGVDQINIVVPSASPTGSVPLSLLVNGIFSPPGVTIAVK